MTTAGRKQRERTERERSIVAAARDLAEAEGWAAVTTRRLAERIEYSQPVLYGHFAGRDQIVAAVALDGFDELAAALRDAVPAGATPRAAVSAIAEAYLAFARRSPAVYQAMFSLDTLLRFDDPTTPPALRAAFAALLDAVGPLAGPAGPELFTEVTWAALHGLATLTGAGRLPAERAPARVELLVERLLGG